MVGERSPLLAATVIFDVRTVLAAKLVENQKRGIASLI